ncbi:hypothetical protein VIGAN_04313900 [Vigna angularis var. angularis]|uniref:Transmembrane protein n=1 Tax=Vigna angularis var. angularis TaxID=157739 RepID=A0A0S3RY88_PHAAN|nr:hypothetical protein VIGAN_04313900 [Vigna angularis var. angularis]
MESKFKNDSFEYINLDGKNVGATMHIHHRSTKVDPKDCCCINIYVNNNVQGVSNSVLHGSQVRMRDPGVSLYFENLKVDRGTPTSTENFFWHNRFGFCLCITNLLVLMFLLVLIFSTRFVIIVF